MIWESYYWKKRLFKLAERLSKRTKQRHWLESTSENVEADICMAAYIVRKLIEASKISTSNISYEFKIKVYLSLGKNVHKYNRLEIDDLYNLDKPKVMTKDIKFIINQIIHSYVFTLCFKNEHRLYSILLNSEYERNKFLYEIKINDLIKYFQKVSNDYPNISIMGMFDKRKGDWVTQQEMIEDVRIKKYLQELDQLYKRAK